MNDTTEQLENIEEVVPETTSEKPVTKVGITKKDKSPDKRAVRRAKDSRKKNRIKSRHKKTKKEKRATK